MSTQSHHESAQSFMHLAPGLAQRGFRQSNKLLEMILELKKEVKEDYRMRKRERKQEQKDRNLASYEKQ